MLGVEEDVRRGGGVEEQVRGVAVHSTHINVVSCVENSSQCGPHAARAAVLGTAGTSILLVHCKVYSDGTL